MNVSVFSNTKSWKGQRVYISINKYKKNILSITQYSASPAFTPYFCLMYWRISVVLPTPREPRIDTSCFSQLMEFINWRTIFMLTWAVPGAFYTGFPCLILLSSYPFGCKDKETYWDNQILAEKGCWSKRFYAKKAHPNNLFPAA